MRPQKINFNGFPSHQRLFFNSHDEEIRVYIELIHFFRLFLTNIPASYSSSSTLFILILLFLFISTFINSIKKYKKKQERIALAVWFLYIMYFSFFFSAFMMIKMYPSHEAFYCQYPTLSFYICLFSQYIPEKCVNF